MTSPQLQTLSKDLVRQAIYGAAQVAKTNSGLQPYRVPMDHPRLFEPELLNQARCCAGIRLALVSDTKSLTIRVDPNLKAPVDDQATWTFDLLVDGKLHQRQTLLQAPTTLRFEGLKDGKKWLELYLPNTAPTRIEKVEIDAQATAVPWGDKRPRWLVYGSSITQCGSAAGPSETWPALAARRADLNLTCMGFGGSCQMEPMVARVLADLPADMITLCVGINMHSGHYSPRTFRAALLGLLTTVREGSPEVPIVCISPILSEPREQGAGDTGMTLTWMREQIVDGVDTLQEMGDSKLIYFDGLKLMGPQQAHYLPDQLHPSAEGYHVMARHYFEQVQPLLQKML